MAADGQGTESSKESDSSSIQTTPSLEIQKEEIGGLLKTPLSKGETWYVRYRTFLDISF